MSDEKLIYLIRHGQTEYNRLGMIQGQGIDQPLNEEGFRQAEAFHSKYKDVPFELIVYSALIRSFQTVELFLKKPIKSLTTPLLNEISWGVYEGRVRDAEMKIHFERLMHEWGNENYDYAWPEGESAFDLDNRVQNFLHLLANRPEKTILACSHGRTMRCILTRMFDKPLREMEQFDHENTGLFLIRYSNGKYSMIKQNDISHLNLEIA